LTHIVVADRIWLRRFSEHASGRETLAPVCVLPPPQSLDAVLFNRLDELSQHRKFLDGLIEHWISGVTDSDLNDVLSYANLKGVQIRKRFSGLVLHFFNHQTHHRGQATTLMSQFGKDVGVTDLFALLPTMQER
jgi:uncharacterized damage-inducible protein DinB